MTQSFYQKYRPVQLTDVVGQEKIIASLCKEAESNAFSHAYLLSGSFGSGKTTTARILATLLTCKNRKGHVVCGTCHSCKAIHAGHCIDVREMDGASKRGIDDVRHIIETAQYTPQELERKVYIVDEIHALTKDASSALLKILEEPPPYVVFILCTTDARKLLPTIMSRCQRFNFTKIDITLMAKHLVKIATGEKIKLDEGSALAIARMSHGSLRDALGFLEQIAIAYSQKVVLENVRSYFGVPEKRLVNEIVQMIVNINATGLLDKVNELLVAGVDIKVILVELSELFRSIFIIKSSGANSGLIDAEKDEREVLQSLANKITLSGLIKIAGLFGKIERDVSININERWILEAALVNCILIVKNEAIKPKA